MCIYIYSFITSHMYNVYMFTCLETWNMFENPRASHTPEASEEDPSIGATGPATWGTLEGTFK